MPVRFRCRECRSKLSIARRKGGSTITCPTCSAAVVVPTADESEVVLVGHTTQESANGAGRPSAAPSAPLITDADLDDLPLFERDDFAKMLEPPSREAWEAKEEPKPKPAEPPKHASPDGILILRSTATILVAAVVVLLGLAFAAGFLVGSR